MCLLQGGKAAQDHLAAGSVSSRSGGGDPAWTVSSVCSERGGKLMGHQEVYPCEERHNGDSGSRHGASTLPNPVLDLQ